MAIKVSGTEVVSSSRELTNITGIDATTQATFENALDLSNRSVGTVTGNATLDLSTGTIFEHTPTANTTFVFSNAPASGTGYSFDLKVTGAVIVSGYIISGASYDSVSFSVASQEISPRSVAFKPDGTKMYVVGATNDTVYQYTLSTAYDVSTASYDNVSFSVASPTITPVDLVFKPDGTKMYVCHAGEDAVYQYTLSTAFDLSTASYDSVSFIFASQDTSPVSLAFNLDGTKMYMVGTISGSVHQYTLSTAYDVSTASYDSVSFSVASQDTTPYDIAFNLDGTKMYMLGTQSNTVYQYSTGTSSTATFTYPASVSWLDASAPSDPADAEVLSLQFFTTDGGTTYYGSKNGNLFTDADHTKLDGIEAGADVTDTANVTSAGALMDSELADIAAVKALDQGVATTDSPTFVNLTSTGFISGRVNPRTTAASGTSGTLTPNSDTTDVWNAFGLSGATTIETPSGTPVDGQKLVIRLKDDGTARAITWTTSSGAFRAIGVELPTTTTISKVTYVGCVYNDTDSFWDVVAAVTEV